MTKTTPLAPKKGPGRPKKPGNGGPQAPAFPDLASTSTTTTQNQFEPLNNDEDLSETDSLMEVQSQASKRRRISNSQNDQIRQPKAAPKPPPINISGKSFTEVQQILASTSIPRTDYQTKLTPQGVRVFASNDDVYKLIYEKLRTDEAKFYTHQLREEQTTKFVLHGLYKMSETELLEKLAEADIKPSKVKTLTIRQQKYSDHCVYLLHFPKVLKMKISKLREIKAIDQVIVRWEYYKNKRNGPIQCSRCMQFGHGKQSCFLDPICMRCGNNHETNACEFLKDPVTKEKVRDKIEEKHVKCGLCGQNHTANFSKCEKRVEFINRQNLYRQRTQRRNRQQPSQPKQPEQPRHAFRTAPELNDFNYPSMPQRNQEIPNFRRREAAEVEPRTDGRLYTPSELMKIMAEIIRVSKTARNQEEQILAVSDIIDKYANHGFTR